MTVTTQQNTPVLPRTIGTLSITIYQCFTTRMRPMSNHARTGEALLDMLQRTLYEFEDGTNADPTDRADYSPDSRLP